MRVAELDAIPELERSGFYFNRPHWLLAQLKGLEEVFGM